MEGSRQPEAHDLEDHIVWGAGSKVPIKTLHGYWPYARKYNRDPTPSDRIAF